MHKTTATLTQKGQVTIPAEIREALGLRPRDRVEFELLDGVVRLRRAESVVDRWYGAFPVVDRPRSVQELREEFEAGVAEEVRSEG